MGIPIIQFSGKRHFLDHEHCKFLSIKAELLLKKLVPYKLGKKLEEKDRRGQHQAGTARMVMTKNIVTNKYGQIHDVDNLFVADGSLIPNKQVLIHLSTIMALGFWVGNYIGSNFKHLLKHQAEVKSSKVNDSCNQN